MLKRELLLGLIAGIAGSPTIVGYTRMGQGLTQTKDYWEAWLEAPWLSVLVILGALAISALYALLMAPLIQRTLIRHAASPRRTLRLALLRIQILSGFLLLIFLTLLAATLPHYFPPVWGMFVVYSALTADFLDVVLRQKGGTLPDAA